MKKKTWWKIVLALIVVGGITIYAAEIYLEKQIQKELQIQNSAGDTLLIRQVGVSLLKGSLTLDDLTVRWNITQNNQRDSLANYLVRGVISKIQLRDFSFVQYFFNDKIQIGAVLIDSSLLALHQLPATRTPSPTFNNNTDKKSLSIAIKTIAIDQSKIQYFEDSAPSPTLEVSHLDLKVEEIQYPKKREDDSFIRNLNWTIRGFRYGSPSALSDLLIAEAKGDSEDKSLLFSKFQLSPRYTKGEFRDQLSYKKSRLAIAIAQGQMEDLNWKRLLSEGKIESKKMTLSECDIEVYEDSRLPNDESQNKLLYQEKLLQSSLGITVDSILVHRGKITYLIRPKLPNLEDGSLEFLNLEATIYNLTNDSAKIATNPLARVQIDAHVNDESKLETYFTFDLNSPEYAYSYAGKMQAFKLSNFNTILSETARMSIVAGEMQALSFNVNANKYLATGEMRIDYSDLKIEWLDKHNRLAALAQKLVMREQNPKKDNYRVGQIYFERLPSRSFWNFYVKSLLSGLTSTAMPNLLLPKELDSKKEKK